MLWLVRFAFSKEEDEEEEGEEEELGQSVKIVFTCIHTSCDIFIVFLHAVTFSHVLHLDVLRRQIELKLKVKIEISLCMAIMQNHPLPSLYIYTVLPYCVIHTKHFVKLKKGR